jgi:hypothetical protein
MVERMAASVAVQRVARTGAMMVVCSVVLLAVRMVASMESGRRAGQRVVMMVVNLAGRMAGRRGVMMAVNLGENVVEQMVALLEMVSQEGLRVVTVPRVGWKVVRRVAFAGECWGGGTAG